MTFTVISKWHRQHTYLPTLVFVYAGQCCTQCSYRGGSNISRKFYKTQIL